MIHLRDVEELRALAFQNPVTRADEALPPEHIRNSAKGWYIGLSINA